MSLRVPKTCITWAKWLVERGRALGAWPMDGAPSGGRMIFGLWA